MKSKWGTQALRPLNFSAKVAAHTTRSRGRAAFGASGDSAMLRFPPGDVACGSAQGALSRGYASNDCANMITTLFWSAAVDKGGQSRGLNACRRQRMWQTRYRVVTLRWLRSKNGSIVIAIGPEFGTA